MQAERKEEGGGASVTFLNAGNRERIVFPTYASKIVAQLPHHKGRGGECRGRLRVYLELWLLSQVEKVRDFRETLHHAKFAKNLGIFPRGLTLLAGNGQRQEQRAGCGQQEEKSDLVLGSEVKGRSLSDQTTNCRTDTRRSTRAPPLPIRWHVCTSRERVGARSCAGGAV